jgi:hypothetical protein
VLFALLAALAWSPALPHATSKPRPVERDPWQILAKEKAITLIPEVGPPARYWCWVTEAKPLPTHDKVFTLRTAGHSLVELLPRVPGTAFRFSAEIWQQTQSNVTGLVGIYFGHGGRDTPHGREHSFYKLAFSDIVSKAKRNPQLNLPGNQIPLNISLCYETPYPWCSNWSTGREIVFQPAGKPGATSWRKLVVEVRPDAVRAHWGDEEPVIIVPLLSLRRQTNQFLEGHPYFKPGNVSFGRPSFRLSRALGLYLYAGIAAFRNVKVELLQ